MILKCTNNNIQLWRKYVIDPNNDLGVDELWTYNATHTCATNPIIASKYLITKLEI